MNIKSKLMNRRTRALHPRICLDIKVDIKHQIPFKFWGQIIYSALRWILTSFMKEEDLDMSGSCRMMTTAELDK